MDLLRASEVPKWFTTAGGVWLALDQLEQVGKVSAESEAMLTQMAAELTKISAVANSVIAAALEKTFPVESRYANADLSEYTFTIGLGVLAAILSIYTDRLKVGRESGCMGALRHILDLMSKPAIVAFPFLLAQANDVLTQFGDQGWNAILNADAGATLGIAALLGANVLRELWEVGKGALARYDAERQREFDQEHYKEYKWRNNRAPTQPSSPKKNEEQRKTPSPPGTQLSAEEDTMEISVRKNESLQRALRYIAIKLRGVRVPIEFGDRAWVKKDGGLAVTATIPTLNAGNDAAALAGKYKDEISTYTGVPEKNIEIHNMGKNPARSEIMITLPPPPPPRDDSDDYLNYVD